MKGVLMKDIEKTFPFFLLTFPILDTTFLSKMRLKIGNYWEKETGKRGDFWHDFFIGFEGYGWSGDYFKYTVVLKNNYSIMYLVGKF